MLAWKPYKILNCDWGLFISQFTLMSGHNITILFMKIAVIYDSRDCKQLFFVSTCENLT